MSISQRSIYLIWCRSGGRCYLDRSELLSDAGSTALPIGEIAHIVAEKKSGPRGMYGLPISKRGDTENLLLVCPTHHRIIDKNPKEWPVGRLREIKRRHEQWVKDTLERDLGGSPSELASDLSLQINFEAATVREGDVWFSFSVKNQSPRHLTLAAIDAQILSTEEHTSENPWEVVLRHFACYTIDTRRRPLGFDFRFANGDDTVTATKPAMSKAKGRKTSAKRVAAAMVAYHDHIYDPFEVAIRMMPGSSECFSARVLTGNFRTGTFRLIATYWEAPAVHQKAYSEAVGFFHVRDRSLGEEARATLPEVRVISFDELVSAAVDGKVWRAGVTRGRRGDHSALLRHTLGRLDDTRSRAVIDSWLKADVSKLWTALEALRASGSSQWKIDTVARCLSSASDEVRAAAVHILGTVRSGRLYGLNPRSEELVRRALDDTSPLVRRAAAEVLRHTDDTELIAKLKGIS